MKRFTNLGSVVTCLAGALDLVDPGITGHHRQVAYLSCILADALAIPLDEKQTLVGAALLHNIGEIVPGSSCPLPQAGRELVYEHAFVGANLLADLPDIAKISKIIEYHHLPWGYGRGCRFGDEEVPLVSRIINLASKVVARFEGDRCVASNVERIKEYAARQRGAVFDPDVVDAFLSACEKKALWLDLSYEPALSEAIGEIPLDATPISLDEAVDLTRVFSRLIDFRSRFTAAHSVGVAASAVKLAELAHMSESECKKMSIAGNLHDIGKLAIPDEILEKHGALDPSEYDTIRSHSYYTYQLLHSLEGFGEISEWAAYHHERLDGRGYPFRLDGDDLSLGARIMAVADIFTAITEDRPYRSAMPKDRAIFVLNETCENGGISPFLCSLLFDNYDVVDEARRKASEEAIADFEAWRRKVASKASEAQRTLERL